MTRQWRKLRTRRKPRLVVDTNLFVSGLISPLGASSKLIDRLVRQKYYLCLNHEIYEEYKDVIREFEKIPKSHRERLLGKIRQYACWVKTTETCNIVKMDPSDNKFLDCALEAKADFIVTGDKHHLLSILDFKIPIVSLAELNAILGWR